jgi:acyl-CoA thioesterase
VHDLEEATRPKSRAPGVYDFEIADGWQQGRGAFGGLVIAALVRAIEHAAESPDRTLRSLTAELPGPAVVGPAEIRVEPVRVGSGQSTLSAKLIQEGEARACAVAVLARPRAEGSGEFCELTPPELRPWREVPVLPMDFGAPTFTQNFVFASDGPHPFAGGKEALARGWIRAKRAGKMSATSLLVALADAWWPATFSRWPSMRPLATVSFTMQVLGRIDALDPEIPLAYRGRAWVQSQGWFVEQRELWTESGRLLALDQQTFAIIK